MGADNIIILDQGYARKNKKGSYFASSTAVLIQCASGKKILVDPGNSPARLQHSIDRRQQNMNDIDMVFLTHHHADHIRNKRLFPKATVVDGEEILHDRAKTPSLDIIPGTEIEVISTPGHVKRHTSLLVCTDQGKFAIAGDVFWWEDKLDPAIQKDALLGLPDPLAQDWPALKLSRLKLLQIADYIIPGHGRTFRSPLTKPATSSCSNNS